MEDILCLLKNGSSNDIRIILEDGEIQANKDVLSTRCEYFAAMFSNKEIKFIEGETNSVDMSHCTKVIMDKIITYLFSGEMKLNDLKLDQQLKLMNMASLMLLDELFVNVENYISDWLPDTGVNCGSLPELVSGLMLAEQFKLDDIKAELLLELYTSLKDIPHIPDVVESYDNFKILPFSLVKEILLFDWIDYVAVDGAFVPPTTKERFDAFVFWLNDNDSACNDQDKQDIVNSFSFDDFTGEELLTDVRKSALYSIAKIDKKILDMLKEKDSSIAAKNRLIVNKDKWLEKYESTIEELRRKVDQRQNKQNPSLT